MLSNPLGVRVCGGGYRNCKGKEWSHVWHWCLKMCPMLSAAATSRFHCTLHLGHTLDTTRLRPGLGSSRKGTPQHGLIWEVVYSLLVTMGVYLDSSRCRRLFGAEAWPLVEAP